MTAFVKPGPMLDVAMGAAHEAGDLLLTRLGTLRTDEVRNKARADFVTEVDRESENLIIRRIRNAFSDHAIFTEESLREETDASFRWIIDPLDGTTNFIHGFPVFCVSIALEQDNEIVLGVVRDPLRNETFHAVKGGGVFVNGQPIAVSARPELDEGLVATGFPFKMRQELDRYLETFRRIFNRAGDIRRAGSAALDLAWLAAGRVDGFWELGLQPWDVAAGSLLIREAGGIITDFEGGPDAIWTGHIVGGTPAVHRDLLGIVREVFPENPSR